MNMNSLRSSTLLAATTILLAVGAASSIAAAQPAPTGGPGLGGPKVTDNNPPGARGGFGEGSTKISKKDRPVEIPLPVFLKAVRETLSGDSTLALTADQKTKIDEMETSFRAAGEKFRKEHGQELRNLMSQMGGPEGRGPGGPEGPGGKGGKGGEGGPGKRGPGGPDAKGGPEAAPGDRPAPAGEGQPRRPRGEGRGEGRPGGGEGRPGGAGRGPGGPGGPGEMADRPQLTAEQREALMTKVRELREKGPNPADQQKAVWAVLTAEQQAAVQPKLDAFMKERTEQRGQREADAKARKQIQQKDAQDAGAEPKPRQNPGRPARKPSPNQPAPGAPGSEQPK